jgi:hypothetical protein
MHHPDKTPCLPMLQGGRHLFKLHSLTGEKKKREKEKEGRGRDP